MGNSAIFIRGMTKTAQAELPTLVECLEYFDPPSRDRLLRENPGRTIQVIKILEHLIGEGHTAEIIRCLYGQDGARILFRKASEFSLNEGGTRQEKSGAGRQALIDLLEAEWSVMFARDKLMLYDLGLLSAKGGDLRKGKLVAPQEQVLALLRWQEFRHTAEAMCPIIISVVKRGGKDARDFFRRLGEVIAKTPTTIPEARAQLEKKPHRQLQMFILDNWASECNLARTSEEKPILLPPLYTFKNEALFDCLYELVGKAEELDLEVRYRDVLGMDAASFGMIWRRLGLKRPKTGIWSEARFERNRRNFVESGRLVISDGLVSRNNAI